MAADTIVRARIDANTKVRATAALEAMGLSVSDAIRLLMLRIADEQRLPFAIEVPNAATRRAMKELKDGKGRTYWSTTDMVRDVGLSCCALPRQGESSGTPNAPFRRGKDISKLTAALDLLLPRQPSPAIYGDPPLKGDWKGWRDLHLEPDWLLIYRVAGARVELAATGAHSALFDA